MVSSQRLTHEHLPQYLHFQAVDRPLDDAQLAFMQAQSTRAEVSRWQFTNEYHYGDFRGDAEEMMRRGFDVHLHYANFGIRRLLFRLPAGLPWDDALFRRFVVSRGLRWIADKQGPGGILEFYPEADAGTYAEDIFEPGEIVAQIVGVRDLLLAADLRPLYLGWLASPWDDDETEPPIPAGLGALPASLQAMAEFYEIDDQLVVAAAQLSPPLTGDPEQHQQLRLSRWIKRQPVGELRELVEQLLAADAVAARAETLARIREETALPAWPTAAPQRTLGELRTAAEELWQRRRQQEEREREAARRKRLASLAADPNAAIAKVQQLVLQRSTSAYDAAASELADLREALGPVKGPAQTAKVVNKLLRDHPTLHRLKSALRKRGLY